LDQIAEASIRADGAIPTFKGIYGDPLRGIPPFPATLCISVNDEVVHGIPSGRKLKEGDIVALDCGVTLEENGRTFVADSAATVPVGKVSDELKKLIEVTEQSLLAGVEQARVGNHLHDIGAAVEGTINPHGFGIVREYFGHGTGYRLHEDPLVPNYGRTGTGPRIKNGWCLALEPMVNIGGDEVYTLPDKWTVSTRDGSFSAHFEHTVAITDEGPEILTRRDLDEVQ
jgi:methionyl aminopeptidase